MIYRNTSPLEIPQHGPKNNKEAVFTSRPDRPPLRLNVRCPEISLSIISTKNRRVISVVNPNRALRYNGQ